MRSLWPLAILALTSCRQVLGVGDLHREGADAQSDGETSTAVGETTSTADADAFSGQVPWPDSTLDSVDMDVPADEQGAVIDAGSDHALDAVASDIDIDPDGVMAEDSDSGVVDSHSDGAGASFAASPKGHWDDIERAPRGRSGHKAFWTGSEMLVYGGDCGGVGCADIDVYNPAAPSGQQWRTVKVPGRQYFGAVWTGTQLIVWGGAPNDNTGFSYDPRNRGVSPLPLAVVDGGAIAGRRGPVTVWSTTTDEMIVWGGGSSDGAAYDPARGTWRTIATSPFSELVSDTGVWAGTRMVVFGSPLGGNQTGAIYDPKEDRWYGLVYPEVLSGHPRNEAVGLATGPGGSYATFFGGGRMDLGYLGDGVTLLDPEVTSGTGHWIHFHEPQYSDLDYPARAEAAVVYGGNRLWMWGGVDGAAGGTEVLGTGASCDPTEPHSGFTSWEAMPTENAPSPRFDASAVWTGRDIILFGGSSSTGAGATVFADGKRFVPDPAP